jgi:hypothetical protein
MPLLHRILLLNLILVSAISSSALTLKNVSGVSYFNLEEAKKIYGGTTGTCPSGEVSSSTCNTCTQTGAGLKPCNQNNIHGALNIVFSYQSSSDLTGKKVTLSIGKSDQTDLTQLESVDAPTAQAGATISTTWSQVCSRVSGMNSSCAITSSADQTVSTDKSFFIDVVDSNNTIETPERVAVNISLHAINPTGTAYDSQTFCAGGAASGYGLCFYSLYYGDEKLIILGDPPPLGNSGPPDGSPAFQAVAFFPFRQNTGITAVGIGNGDVQPVIKKFVSTTDLTIEDPYIGGLENGLRYCVIAGQMNLAQNIFGFTTTGMDENHMCQRTSEVIGILDGKKCFISTAAFGSDMANEVQIFRNFRDAFLLPHRWGIDFVKAYYKYGPIGAEFISDSEPLKILTRGALYPLVAFSWIALNYGIWPAFLVLMVIAVLLFSLQKKISDVLKSKRSSQTLKSGRS